MAISLSDHGLSGRRARSAGALALAVLAAASAAAAASPATLPRSARALLPHACPPIALVRSTLRVKVSKVTTYTSELEYPYGSAALPVKRPPAYQKTCVYSADGRFAGQIVPTTISFAAAVSRRDFDSARSNAAKSVAPYRIAHLGDAAWAVAPPKLDPRAGGSVFVLKGSLDIVLTAPGQAPTGRLVALARKLL